MRTEIYILVLGLIVTLGSLACDDNHHRNRLLPPVACEADEICLGDDCDQGKDDDHGKGEGEEHRDCTDHGHEKGDR